MLDDMLSLQGNTAVYLLYAHARIAAIGRKAGVENIAALAHEHPVEVDHEKERSLALHVSLCNLHTMSFTNWTCVSKMSSSVEAQCLLLLHVFRLHDVAYGYSLQTSLHCLVVSCMLVHLSDGIYQCLSILIRTDCSGKTRPALHAPKLIMSWHT